MLFSFARKPTWVVVLSLIAIAVSPAFAPAGTFTYIYQGASVGYTVDVQAVLVTSANQLTVTIYNYTLTENTREVNQVITGVRFSGAAAGTLISGTGHTANIGSDKTYTGAGPTSLVVTDDRWTFNSNFLSVWPSQPSLGIIGIGLSDTNTLASGTYTNATSSIAGNGPHNPFVLQRADFVISVADMTANSVISNFEFHFGTSQTQGFFGGTQINAVPEPSTTALASIGIIGMFGGAFRKWQKRRQQAT